MGTTTTENRERNKLATFDTAVDGAAAAGPSATSDGTVDDTLVTAGSGGSTISATSNGGNGGSVGGLASSGTILINEPISGGTITYGAVPASGSVGRHGHAAITKRKEKAKKKCY